MATYLELCKLTRTLTGMQGTGPSSVLSQIGIEDVLVKMVRDAYIDIQNLREEWDFLEAQKSFLLVAGKDTYTQAEIFLATPEFKKYKKDSFIITDLTGHKSYLRYCDRDVLEARYLNDNQQTLPTQYTIDPPTQSLVFKPIPDGAYTVDFRYWKSPEILSTDAQVPSLPLSFHKLIAYKATEKMAVYLGSPDTYREYSFEANRMIGQLMRMSIPKKRMRAGAFV